MNYSVKSHTAGEWGLFLTSGQQVWPLDTIVSSKHTHTHTHTACDIYQSYLKKEKKSKIKVSYYAYLCQVDWEPRNLC